jgi:hypothetical protein
MVLFLMFGAGIMAPFLGLRFSGFDPIFAPVFARALPAIVGFAIFFNKNAQVFFHQIGSMFHSATNRADYRPLASVDMKGLNCFSLFWRDNLAHCPSSQSTTII